MTRYGPPPIEMTSAQAALRAAAFRLLLESDEPVGPQRLARALGTATGPVVADLDLLAGAGRIKRNAAGEVLGSLGLTLTRTNHEIEVNGVRRHTYCALDALGILGALAADGWIDSMNPATGDRFHLTVTAGVPGGHDPSWVLFVAGQDPVTSVIDQWCPLVNFFADQASALGWASTAGAAGGCLDLTAAARLATGLWLPLVSLSGAATVERGQPGLI